MISSNLITKTNDRKVLHFDGPYIYLGRAFKAEKDSSSYNQDMRVLSLVEAEKGRVFLFVSEDFIVIKLYSSKK